MITQTTIDNTSIRYLKGVGPKKEGVLQKLGIYTIKDILYYFPYKYEDRSQVRAIKDLNDQEVFVIKAKVTAKKFKPISYYVKNSKVRNIFEVLLSDGDNLAHSVWFNQGFLNDLIQVGDLLYIYGKPSWADNIWKFNSPEYEVIKGPDSLNMARIIGVYSLTQTLTQKNIRKLILSCFEQFKTQIADPIPFDIRKELNLLNIVKSFQAIHMPSSWQEAKEARRRFIFEELFFSQVLVYLRKARRCSQRGITITIKEETIAAIRNNLPFSLTLGQQEAIEQIIDDFSKAYPMHRLLQGDVGCGKTVVAAFAMGICLDSGVQVACMVPTEVLAYQHKESFDNIFKNLPFTIEVLTASLPKEKVLKIRERLKSGEINIIIGTHALLQEEVEFKNLGLVIIDEQHKFGVAQRALLPKKAKANPHCLVMSATPIPRSLALSLYGDLDLSIIKQMPQGRLKPENIWLKDEQRQKAYDLIKEQLKAGRQAYIVYPVIEESLEQDLKSLELMYEEVKKEFAPYNVGMFHGKMKAQDKVAIIQAFKKKEVEILVATTVVEVGVNVINASVMMVENAHRFGLAQLHQLRGRIQRSVYQPYFLVISSNDLTESANRRLEVITSETDGFKIAEEDLKLRGPGDFFGNMQHGLPNLRVANPLEELETLKIARVYAYKLIKSDPYLEGVTNRCIKEHLEFWLQDRGTERVT